MVGNVCAIQGLDARDIVSDSEQWGLRIRVGSDHCGPTVGHYGQDIVGADQCGSVVGDHVGQPSQIVDTDRGG